MLARLLACLLAAAAVAGCADAAPRAGAGDRRLEVVVGVYPYAWVAEQVGADGVRVRNVSRPGAEPHDVELTAKQVGAVADADLVVLSHGFQPALDDAARQEARGRVLDVLDEVPVLGDDDSTDPHVWLDPVRLAGIGDAVAARLERAAPGGGFAQRAAALRSRLEDLDGELRAGLASCERRDLVTAHEAFGYLADRYGLRQVGVSGLSPDAEPPPRRLAEVARLARERDVTTVFFEERVSPRVARQLAREVGARTAVLDPLETRPDDGDYVSALRGDLDALRAALGCA